MALFFVTGIAGAGKTAVCRELKTRGYEAHDIDVEPPYAKWRNKQTGYVHPKSSVKPHQRTQEFIESHAWVVSREEVEALAEKANNKTIFLCGAIGNEDELLDLFDGSVALTIDDETLKHRLRTRAEGNWGKRPEELQKSLERQHSANEMHKRHDHTFIDATKPLTEVVDDILAYANPKTDEQEMIDVLDEDGQVVATVTREEAERDNHVTQNVLVFVFNSAGKVWVQLRPMSKKHYPGKWDISACGGVHSGETHETAAQRETREETGLGIELHYVESFLNVFEGDDGEERKRLSHLYVGVSDEAPQPNEEVDEFKAWEPAELEADVATNETNYIPSFLVELEKALEGRKHLFTKE